MSDNWTHRSHCCIEFTVCLPEKLSLRFTHEEKYSCFHWNLLVTSCNKLPKKRLYSTLSPDVLNNLFPQSLRRDSLDAIMRSIHFENNMELDNDRLNKFHTLLQSFNRACSDLYIPEYISVDVSIVL